MIHGVLDPPVLVLPLHYIALSMSQLQLMLGSATCNQDRRLAHTEHANVTYFIVERIMFVRITDIKN